MQSPIHLSPRGSASGPAPVGSLRIFAVIAVTFRTETSSGFVRISALRIKPEEVCLVPEKREEVTTEGGLDVISQRKELEPTIRRLQVAGIRVSLFIDPTLEQVDAAAELGVEMVELHTGKLANAFTEKFQKEELEQLRAAARAGSESHMQVNAGHGINYKNIGLINQIPCLTELNIGHSIISRAMWVGLETAVKEMLSTMATYPE